MLERDEIIAWLEGRMAPEERAAFEERCAADSESMKAALSQYQLEIALRVVLATPDAAQRVKRSVMAVLEGTSANDLRRGILRTTSRPSRSRTRIFASAFALMAAAITLMAGIWQWQIIAHLESGSAVHLLGNGQEQVLVSPAAIRQGDRLRLTAFSTVLFGDGTRLSLHDGSICTLDTRALPWRPWKRAKYLSLDAGTLRAEVAPQPAESPMQITTRFASATVVGTKLRISVNADSARLEVEEGHVRFSKNRGTDLELGPHQSALASNSTQQWTNERDPWLWPFAPQSPWNQPIGKNAQFAAMSPATSKPGVSTIGLRWRSIILEEEFATLHDVFLHGQIVATLPFPPGVDLPHLDDGLLCVIDRTRRTATEVRTPSPSPDGSIEVKEFYQVDLRGLGTDHGGGQAGLPAIAGVVRHGETTKGIGHAMALTVNARMLNRVGPGGVPFVWPATSAPGDALSSFGTSGNLFIGTRLAIPPEIDVASLDLPNSPVALELARALQDYGAYIVGTCELQRMNFYLSDAGAPEPLLKQTLERLSQVLAVVVDATPTAPGGAGPARRPLPRPLPQ